MIEAPPYSDLWLKAKAKMRMTFGQSETITVPRWMVAWTGDYPSAVLLNQILYYSSRKQDGWFYKSYPDWFEELLLTENQVRRCLKKLRGMELGLETKVKKANGAPTTHYRVDPIQWEQTLDRRIAEMMEEERPTPPVEDDADDDRSVLSTDRSLGNLRIEPEESEGSGEDESDPSESLGSITREDSTKEKPSRAHDARAGEPETPVSKEDESTEDDPEIEQPKRRGNHTSVRPPNSESSRPRNLRGDVIAFYAFDVPKGSPWPKDWHFGKRIGALLKDLDNKAEIGLLPRKLEARDIANSYEHNQRMTDQSPPRGSHTIFGMVNAWFKAGEPDYFEDTVTIHQDTRGITVPPPDVPVPEVDFEGFPVNMPEEEKARRREAIKASRISASQEGES